MLENIIKSQIEKIEMNEESFNSEQIKKAKKDSKKLIEKISKTDKVLAGEIDDLINSIISIYGEEYFRAGFKDGLRLTNEIKEV